MGGFGGFGGFGVVGGLGGCGGFEGFGGGDSLELCLQLQVHRLPELLLQRLDFLDVEDLEVSDV